MAYLGDTISAIAAEKAGIIKPDQQVIVAAQHPDAIDVIVSTAESVGAEALREGFQFGVIRRENAVGGQVLALRGLHGVYDEVFLPLYGGYQASNASCALAAVEAFAGVVEPARRRSRARRVLDRAVAGPSRGRSHLADDLDRRNAQPGRRSRDSRRDRGVVRVSPPGGRGCRAG